MLYEADILRRWSEAKSGSSHFYQLKVATEIVGEYKGKRLGHPSNYASVRFTAVPSAQLTIDSTATYPSSVSIEYAGKLLNAVGYAAIDELFANEYRYSGCALVLRELGWDEVSSSEGGVPSGSSRLLGTSPRATVEARKGMTPCRRLTKALHRARSCLCYVGERQFSVRLRAGARRSVRR